MRFRIYLTTVASVFLPLVAGCSTQSGVVRSQNPAGYGPYSQTAMSAGMAPEAAAPNSQNRQYDNGANYLWQNAAAQNKIWGPSHFHTYDYQPPKNLSYPPDNQPPAMVQYPYYTLKGPTDFFLQ